jgi:UDP-glucose 4-epimerase
MNLITGSQGFIGSHLYKAVDDPIGIDKKDNKHQQKFIPVDLLFKNELFWVLRDMQIDTVFHLAALPSVPDSYDHPMLTYMNNVNASINLIDVCQKIGVKKIIFASSSSVKGESPYGHSKKIIEEVLEKSGMAYTVLRFFNVFGPRQRNNVVKIMYDKIKANEEVTIFGDGKTTRDFSHVDNVVTACVKAIQSKYDGKILEVGTGKPHSLLDLYDILKAKVNPKHNKIFFRPERIGDIKYSKADTFLTKNEITSFEEGISSWLQSELRDLEKTQVLANGNQELPIGIFGAF